MAKAINKVDAVYQYSLLIASGLDDFYARRLGPIHLLKYLYLADYCYASRHLGQSFSGVEWQFYNFGPWNIEAHARIENSMKNIGADVHKFASEYNDGDFFRFEKNDEYLQRELERELPAIITRNLKQYIKSFSNNTSELLKFVYGTEPMLDAAPNEVLDFQTSFNELNSFTKEEVKALSKEANFSNKKKKNIKKGMSDLRSRLLNSVKTNKLIDPSPEPEYDEVYEKGMAMLEKLDTPEFSESEIVVEFESSVWKSHARKGIYGE